VRGDASRLRQTVENLLSNALKFTPAGGRIDVTTVRDEHIVTITVADSGEGIDADFLPHVFDRFSQADNSSTRRHGGLGLGLAITRHLVERHVGTIEARSAGRGKGSTFIVRLPLDTKDATARPVRGRAPDSGRDLDLSVMLVDDDADTCEGLAIALGETGAQVRIARSAAEALAIDAVTPVSVVISDISMPGSDGYSLIRAIRQRDAERGTRTVAIAMTGLAGREDRDKAVDAGFDEHVAKPIEPSALIAKLRALLAAQGVTRS
jgi:CheY-like chemotaxis protein/anti-sigma regulatory factor (Ser/Thr protein kinase)